MMQAQRQTYREEAYELLDELETSLLALEEAPDDAELIGRVFCAMHTIKGSGAMFGFDDIAAFTHEVETVYDLVRGKRIAVTKSLLDLTLAAVDEVRAMLDGSNGGPAPDGIMATQIRNDFQKLLPEKNQSAVDEAKAPLPAENAEEETIYRIAMRLDRDVFLRGTNPILLLNELRELGECKVIAHTEAIPELEDFNPEECRTSWDVILSTRRGINAIRDVFIFIEDECEVKIDVIGAQDASGDEASPRKLGEILVERGDISPEDVRRALGEQKRIGELLMDAGVVGPSRVESALVEQEHVRSIRNRQQKEELVSNIRVPAERLDILVNLVGELVTVQARLSRTAASMADAALVSIAEEVERLTAELRDNAMSIRMVPIGTTYSKFKRLVR
ncbi:MAG TPA: Hpt domain-containing protein, partial [Syntrophobacteraceae bacterium]|nr:Hpt domain-containing protein [Syntrophobacteraceae bacterium]